MKKMDLWVGDLIQKTAHLTREEFGVYVTLLLHQYATEGPLPIDPDALHRIANAHRQAERNACDRVISDPALKWDRLEDGYWQRRASEEIAKRRDYVEQQRARSALGVAARDAKEPKPPDANGEVKPKSTKRGKPNGLHPISDDWLPSEKTIARLGAEFKLTQTQIQQYFDHFVSACKSKDYKYANFDAAFSNSVRSDWPRLRENEKPAKFDPFNPGPGKAVM